MTIRSVDMQVLVQKAGDVARVQQSHQIDQDRRQPGVQPGHDSTNQS